MSSQGLKLVFGGGSIGNREPWDNAEYINKAIAIMLENGCNTIDSAQLYGKSEETLGQLKAGDKLTLDTKWFGGFQGGWATKDNVVSTGKSSIEKLGVKQVDIFYLHAPDNKIDYEETMAGVNEVYKTGVFKRFGISNFTAAEVEKAYDICKKNGYVLPSVYQGNYSPVARRQENELFPTLRKYDISFYAYSPLAGGFLTKTTQQIKEGAGRFNKESIGGMYLDMYGKPSYLEALAKWEKVANEEGCSRAELAYRWVNYHSPLKSSQGDAIIFGASSHEQLEQTLKGLHKGPLSQKSVDGIEAIWQEIKHEAPLDNFNR